MKKRRHKRTQQHQAALRPLNAVEREKWSSDFVLTCGDCGCVLGTVVEAPSLGAAGAAGRALALAPGANLDDDNVYRFSNDAKKHVARHEPPRYRRGWIENIAGGGSWGRLTPGTYPCRALCPRPMCNTTQTVDGDALGLVVPPPSAPPTTTR